MYDNNKSAVYSSGVFYEIVKHRQNKYMQLLLAICLVTLLTGGMPLIAFSQNLSLQSKIRLKGQVQLPSNVVMPEGKLDVVLLKFVLSSEGQVTPTGPQARVKTDAEGNFEFLNIIPDLRAGYQIGTRVEGKLYSSKVFFMKAGETLIQKNIIIPGISTAVDKLETYRVSLVIESGLGAVTVTEVLALSNSSADRIDTGNQPLKQKLPEGIENFRMMETNSGAVIQHYLEDNVLIIEHVFPTGNSQIIYQYLLPGWFGSSEMNREFNLSLDKVDVLTPEGYLQIKSEQLTFSDKQSFHDITYLTWKTKASDSNLLTFTIRNVPVTSLQYSVVSGVVLLLLFTTVALFFHFRLNNKKRSEESTS